MDVALMRRIVDVTAAGKIPDVAVQAARRWEGNALAHVRSSANHVFRFERAGQPAFLRLSTAHAHTLPRLEAELAFVRHVAGCGVASAQPLSSVHGRLIEELMAEDGDYVAVAFAGLPGAQLEVDELDEAQCRAWGATLARLHEAAQSFPPHPSRPTWLDELRQARADLPPEEHAAAAVLDAGIAWLHAMQVPPQEYGLLHGDFELDNLVWDGHRWQVLDFDGAAYGWYGVDIAIALQDVMSPDDAESQSHRAWFEAGYAAVRALPPGVWDALPRILALVTAAKVAGLQRAYRNVELSPGGSAPEWLVKMHARHERWLAAKRAALHWP